MGFGAFGAASGLGGRPGAVNAALFAAAMLAHDHPAVADALAAFRARQTEEVASHDDPRK